MTEKNDKSMQVSYDAWYEIKKIALHEEVSMKEVVSMLIEKCYEKGVLDKWN